MRIVPEKTQMPDDKSLPLVGVLGLWAIYGPNEYSVVFQVSDVERLKLGVEMGQGGEGVGF